MEGCRRTRYKSNCCNILNTCTGLLQIFLIMGVINRVRVIKVGAVDREKERERERKRGGEIGREGERERERERGRQRETERVRKKKTMDTEVCVVFRLMIEGADDLVPEALPFGPEVENSVALVYSSTHLKKMAREARRKWKEEENTKAVHLQWASSHAESRRVRIQKLAREDREGDVVVPPPSTQCCTVPCSDNFPPNVVAAIRAAHNRLLPGDQRHFYRQRIQLVGNEFRQRQYALDDPDAVASSLQAWSTAKAGDPVLEGGHLVPVCADYFTWVLGVSNNRLYQPTMERVREARNILEPVQRINIRPTMKRALVVETMTYMGAYESIIMPTTGKRILEHPTKKRAIEYVRALMLRKGILPEAVPSPSYCLKVWRETKELKENVMARRTVPFATCETCFDHDESIRATKDPKQKVALFEKKREHKAFINGEKDSYYSRITKAVMNPEQCMSVIIDGADQKNNELPHHAKEGKATSGLWKLPVHNMGALSHGRQAFSFLCTDSMKQGTNATIEVLHRVLLHTRKQEGKLPGTLFVQLDNTTKQCKSQYMIAYLSSLIESGVFHRIIMSFLPVGHTHEDIDQMFSTFSMALRYINAYTREELAAVVRGAFHSNAFKHPIHVEQMDALANYSDFVKDKIKLPEGISRWYQFRFFKEDGVVQVQCRESTTDGTWGGICSSEVRDSLTTTVFKPGMNGRIVPGITMPPAQRRDPLALAHSYDKKTTKVKMYRRALLKFTDVLKLNDEQINSLSKDIEAIASEAPIPFHWSDEDIALLYGHGAPGEEEKKAPAVMDNEEEKFAMEVNKYYIYKPDIPDEPNPDPGVPFRLGLCLQHGSMLDDLLGDNVQYPGAYMLEYMPKSTEWKACKWEPDVRKRNMQQNPFQWDSAVTPWAMKLKKKGHLSKQSIADIGYYLQRWEHPELSDDWADQSPENQNHAPGNMLLLGKRQPKGKKGKKKNKK
jgi:hypothetical protein